MQISFINKFANKQAQEKQQISLNPNQRFEQFLKLSESMARLYNTPNKAKAGNLVLVRESKSP